MGPANAASLNQRFAYRCNGSHFRRHAQATFNFGQPRSEDRGKGCTKLIFTALIALCTVAATCGDEGKFGRARVVGHNYKVVDGRLVDLGPAPTLTPMPSSTLVLSLFPIGPIRWFMAGGEEFRTLTKPSTFAHTRTNSLRDGANLGRRATLKSPSVEKVSRMHLREICQRAALRRDESQP